MLTICTLFYVVYEAIAIVTFIVINNRISEDSEEFILWKTNYEISCGELDMTDAL